MVIEKRYISVYDRRVKLTADAITQHSQMNNDTATKLALHVLRALDHIPEKIRTARLLDQLVHHRDNH